MPRESPVEAAVRRLALVDHHVHGATLAELDRAAFEARLTEADAPAPGATLFDSQIGLAVRRWCAPALDLPVWASPEEYLDARARLGAAEASRRLLKASGVSHYLLDTGFAADEVLDPAGMTALTGVPASTVVRLEVLAEAVAAESPSAAAFGHRVAEEVHARVTDAVGFKTIAAYRCGLDLDGTRPTERTVATAAGDWLAQLDPGASPRLTDSTLIRHLMWCAADTRLPLQVHVGYGDRDLDLARSTPTALSQFIRAVEPLGTPVMLLHCYPYHREAGYLAQVFPHVHLDVGLAVNNLGAAATAVVAESLELAPFTKVMFSSDAWGPAELHLLGAVLWRQALARVLSGFVDRGDWPAAEAVRTAELIGAGNARRVYKLPNTDPN